MMLKPLRFYSGIILLLLFTFGCASGEKFQGVLPAGNDTAVLYIMRQGKFMGSAICMEVAIDKRGIGCIKNAGYITVNLVPGKHLVEVSGSGWIYKASADILLEAGHVYYYEYTTKSKFFLMPAQGIEASLQERSEESALEMLSSLRGSM